MLFLTPALSDYLIFNMLLFVALFLFGYLTQAIPGVTFGMQITLLATVGTLGLNAQQPVTFQSIMGVYFGIVAGVDLVRSRSKVAMARASSVGNSRSRS